jgi:hypothetical protein
VSVVKNKSTPENKEFWDHVENIAAQVRTWPKYMGGDGVTDPNSKIPLLNQRVWDSYPERAKKAALDAIATGGFETDHIERRAGNYEGQVMAIQRGWVKRSRYGHGYEITLAGLRSMKEGGRTIPYFLPAWDSWHGCRFEYCAYTTEFKNGRALRLFKESIPAKGSLGMDPILDRDDVIRLRDFLTEWIVATQGETE